MSTFSDKKLATVFAEKLDRMIDFKKTNCSFDADIKDFLDTLPDSFITRFVEIGLIDEATSARMKPLMVAKKIRPKRSSYVVFDIKGGHLADYKKHMITKGLTPNHIKVTVNNCAKIVAENKWCVIGDITAKAVDTYMSQAKYNGMSARGINSFILALKGFCNWMRKQGLIQESPLRNISKLKTSSEHSVPRRAFSELEVSRLLNATKQGGKCYRVESWVRVLVYEMALTTGLRYNEILTLSRSDFDLVSNTVTIQGKM